MTGLLESLRQLGGSGGFANTIYAHHHDHVGPRIAIDNQRPGAGRQDIEHRGTQGVGCGHTSGRLDRRDQRLGNRHSGIGSEQRRFEILDFFLGWSGAGTQCTGQALAGGFKPVAEAAEQAFTGSGVGHERRLR